MIAADDRAGFFIGFQKGSRAVFPAGMRAFFLLSLFPGLVREQARDAADSGHTHQREHDA